MSFRSDIIDLLKQFLGEEVRGPVELCYAEEQKLELFFLAKKMLIEEIGLKNAKEVLTSFLAKKYPKMLEEVIL